MKKIIYISDNNSENRNELTREMDKHLINQDKKISNIFYSYMMKYPKKNTWIIRYPGATRASILTDKNNIIIDITVYKSSGYENPEAKIPCYKKSVIESVKQFIGYKIVNEIKR